MSGRITAEEEAAPAQAAGGEWTCEICTCINARQRLQCEACESPIQQHEGCTSHQQAKEQLTFQPVNINQRTSSLGHPTKKRKLADRDNNGLKYAQVIGIDWSGAQHAGNTISVAVCRVVRHPKHHHSHRREHLCWEAAARLWQAARASAAGPP